ncbi:MAG: S-layer homology domain-containing protein, partial [Firmicutes bacterium]|nr:S-layer homology domain-containing protein [Bacillota bacterium]
MLKNNKRRFITIILLTLTLLSALFIPTEKARAASSFTDINHHWAYDTILRWENLGVLQDFAIGRFTPDAPITRAEFFALLVRTLGATEQADISQFSDVWQESWYYHIVAIAFNMGIAIGYDDGLMRPDDNLLRQDAITLMARALGMSSANTWILSSYSDYYSISPYASTYLAWFIEKDLLNGYPDGTLRPRNNITRAEAIKLIDNIFPHIHQLESTFYNVYLQGDLLVPKGDAELRDLVLYGDVIIGDGVGQGNVLISNCNINGRLVIRGGGSNSVTLSNSSVNTIYVASFAADTHIAITDNSLVPLIEAVSGFTLSGSGVTALTLLDQARESCLINLNGVNLDEFNIGGRNAKINFISGRSVNINFEGAGQNSILNMANGTSAENINIAAPNVSITGTGLIRSLLVLNSGASVEQKPDFTTVGVNMSAIINGQLIAGPAAAAPNLVNRAKDDSLQVLLLHNNRRLEPFNQDTLNISTTEGRSATEIMVVQDVSGRVSLTEHNGRLAYWIGFFIPEPRQSDNISALTYEYADGSPVTVYKELERYNGQRGLIIYLPVFRKSATETGQLKETLYINWGYGITENLQFMSSTLFLTPLTYDETNILQNEFNKGIFHSIDEERPPYSGAEAIRRILNSDNPLGLPSSNNKGLDALNRSVTPADIRSVLEENQFSQDLTIDTSGNSAYSRLSEDGKNAVAEAVLNGRKTPYATAASVKAIFDKAVSERLTKESTLLSLINGAGDAGALRKIIENSANAAILHFQTGADPYKSYPTVQKDEMAAYLFSLRPYPSLQSVIDAIKDYLNTNEPKEPDTKDAVISGVSASPRTITMASGNKREVKLTVNTSEGKLTPADIGKITTWNWNTTGANSPLADVTLQDDVITLLANNPGRDTLTVSVGGKTTTISVTVSPPKFATALKLNKTSLKLVVDGFERLTYTLTPTDATDNLKWNSDNEAVCIVNGGVVTAVGRGRSIITLESTDNPSLNATCEVWVFHDENDIIITPDIVTLGEGSKYQVRYELYKPIQAGGNVELQWKPANPNIATVTSTGLITAVGLDPNQASEPNKTAITAEVWVAGKPPGTESGTAHITVVVENRRSLEIGITNAIMFQGERQSLEITRLLDPITKQPILPYAPGQQFIWEINEGGKVQFVVNNQVSGSSITLNTTTLPGIQATGIGRSFISVKTSPSEQPIHTIEVVSVPKGVQNMHFFNNGKEITNAEGYGRVLEILNNENAQ